MKVQPLARQSSLVIKELDDETLVYDLESDKAHCLNKTAARVWKNCDGSASVSEIAQRLGVEASGPVDENVVWLALDQLEKFKLLEKPLDKPAAFMSGMSRRQAVRALGVAAIVLPAVSSIYVPMAMAQGSQLPLGACCHNPNDCQSNCCDQIPNPCDCTIPGSDPCGAPNKACKPIDFVAGNPTCKAG